tara:strand:- start:195 stop:386 length:192 start_codon:yes stop_codon:yes gene_type:complete
MTEWNVERNEIRSMMLEDSGVTAVSESLMDKIEDMLTESFSAGYSFAKNENELVRKASESLSE